MLKAQSAECRSVSPSSEVEIFNAKASAWNQKCISDRILVLNNDQIAKLSNREFETVVNIGNRLYAKGKK